MASVFKGFWPTVSLLMYLVMMPTIPLCSMNVGMMIISWIFVFSIITIDLFMAVERSFKGPSDERKANMTNTSVGAWLIMNEVCHILRVFATTLLPIMLATVGGASYVATTGMLPRFDGCSVNNLAHLAVGSSGYDGFSCQDGYIPIDIQIGVPAWQDAHIRRLSSSFDATTATVAPAEPVGTLPPAVSVSDALTATVAPTLAPGAVAGFLDAGLTPTTVALATPAPVLIHTAGTSPGNRFVFVAPIFENRAAFEGMRPPVAWAVKAGKPVRRSMCDNDQGLPGTCGLFVEKIQDNWARIWTPPGIGEFWGYNITHASRTEMSNGVQELQRSFTGVNLTAPADAPFVIAENVREYFGVAYPLLYVTFTLLGVGLLDRIVAVFDYRIEEASGDASEASKYKQMMTIGEQDMEENPQNLMEQASGFWNDPLSSSRTARING